MRMEAGLTVQRIIASAPQIATTISRLGLPALKQDQPGPESKVGTAQYIQCSSWHSFGNVRSSLTNATYINPHKISAAPFGYDSRMVFGCGKRMNSWNLASLLMEACTNSIGNLERPTCCETTATPNWAGEVQLDSPANNDPPRQRAGHPNATFRPVPGHAIQKGVKPLSGPTPPPVSRFIELSDVHHRTPERNKTTFLRRCPERSPFFSFGLRSRVSISVTIVHHERPPGQPGGEERKPRTGQSGEIFKAAVSADEKSHDRSRYGR